VIDARWSNPHRSLRRPGMLDLLLLRSRPMPASGVKVTVRFSTNFTVSQASLIGGEPPVTRVLPVANGGEWTCSLTESDRWIGLLLRVTADVPEGRSADKYKVGSVLAEAAGQPRVERPLEIEYVSEQDDRLQGSDELVMTLGVLAFDPDESEREAARRHAVTLLGRITGSPPGDSPGPNVAGADKRPQEEPPAKPAPPGRSAQPQPMSPPPLPPRPIAARDEQAFTATTATAQPAPTSAERLERELRELCKAFEVSEAPSARGARRYWVNVQGVQLTLSINLHAWPLKPPSVEVDPRWRHRMVDAEGQVKMPCLRGWNQTFPLAHVVRSFEREWREAPGRWQEGEPPLQALGRFMRRMMGGDGE
jgi:hypothetical protein